MRKLVTLPSLSNVTAGSTAVLNCPVGLTYEVISLVYTGVTLAQMQNIELVVNGKTIQKFADAQELNVINQYYSRGSASGILNLWLERPELRNLSGAVGADDSKLTVLGTADVQTVSLKIDIDGAASAPVISASAIQSAPQPLGMITKIKRFPVSFSTSGEQDIDNIPRSGARIAAIHCLKNDVTKVKVDVNSATVFEASKTLANELQDRYGRDPQGEDMTTVDFLMGGNIRNALSTKGVQDLRVQPTIATSGALVAIVEYLDGFEGI